MNTEMNIIPPLLPQKRGNMMTTKYRLLEIHQPLGQGVNGFTVHCTDRTVLEWIVGELKKIVPDASIGYSHLDLVTSQPYMISIDKLKSKDYVVVWMTLKVLCENGWKLVNTFESHPVKIYEFTQEFDI